MEIIDGIYNRSDTIDINKYRMYKRKVLSQFGITIEPGSKIDIELDSLNTVTSLDNYCSKIIVDFLDRFDETTKKFEDKPDRRRGRPRKNSEGSER